MIRVFRRLLVLAALAVFAAALLPAAGGYAVFSLLRKDFEGRLQGRFVPAFFSPTFGVSDVQWEFPGKVKVRSGNVRVRYWPETFFDKDGIRIHVTGEKLPVEVTTSLLGHNFKKITLERVVADIKLRDGELREIYRLEVVSPELNLKMGQ